MEETLSRVVSPREWGVIVEPVELTVEKDQIPSPLLIALKLYKDELPPFKEARQAYDQFLAQKRNLN